MAVVLTGRTKARQAGLPTDRANNVDLDRWVGIPTERAGHGVAALGNVVIN